MLENLVRFGDPAKISLTGIEFGQALAMVLGVFVGRWTVPTLLRGTTDVFSVHVAS